MPPQPQGRPAAQRAPLPAVPPRFPLCRGPARPPCRVSTLPEFVLLHRFVRLTGEFAFLLASRQAQQFVEFLLCKTKVLACRSLFFCALFRFSDTPATDTQARKPSGLASK